MDSGGGSAVREFFYGRDENHLFVRVAGVKEAQFGIEFESGANEVKAAQVKTAKGRIVEIESPLAGSRFRVTVALDGLPPARVPADGWIEIPRSENDR
jgi:hypothetical protein